MRRNVRIAVFREVAVRRPANEASVARGIEPSARFTRHGDLHRLLRLSAATALSLLMFATRSTPASSAMPSSVASLVKLAAAFTTITAVTITSITLRCVGLSLGRGTRVDAVVIPGVFARVPTHGRRARITRCGPRWRTCSVRGRALARARLGFAVGARGAADFDTGFSSTVTAAIKIVAIGIVAGLATGPVGRTLTTSATRWASTFAHAAVG